MNAVDAMVEKIMREFDRQESLGRPGPYIANLEGTTVLIDGTIDVRDLAIAVLK